MSRADYGRAFKIRPKDVRSYGRTKSYRSNPMGVTTLAQLNGPGAYSARRAATGKSKSQRIAAARRLLNKNSGGNKMQKRGRRASFVSNATPAAKRRGKRLAAYNEARRRGHSKNKASRSALRKVPWTAGERSGGASFQGMTANKRGGKRKSTMTPNAVKKRKAPKRKKIRSSAAPTSKAKKTKDPKRVAAGRKAARTRKQKGTKVATKAKAKRKTTKKRRKATGQYKQVKTTKRVRVQYGKYKRVRMKNPRTGKMQYSYMYRTKSGKMRRIPTSAIVGKKVKGTKELPAKVRKARVRAARRIMKSGGAFVPNASRGRRRAAEKGRLVRKGMSKAKASRAALRKYPFTEAEKRKGKRMLKSGKIVTRKSAAGKRKVSRKGARKVSRKGKKRKTTKRKAKTSRKGVSRKRSLAAKKGWRKRRAAGTAPKKRTKRTAKRGARRGKMSKSKRSAAAKKGWRTRKQRYGAKGHRKNADTFVQLFSTVALVGVGFLLHRGLTAGVCLLLTGDQNAGADTTPEETVASTSGVGRLRRRRRGMRGLGQNSNGSNMTKPLIGGAVALVGSVGAMYVGGESGPALAAGMIASVIGQGLVAVAKVAGQPELAAALGGYSNSMAFNLRGVGRVRRRRGVRGVGQYPAVRGGRSASIMPRYRQVGAFMQAAAGTHNPNRPVGEYFTPNAVGEYFAPANLSGVGAYEPAGLLAMQASAGLGQQPIDDGIRPDTNLDRVLDLAEAAAGLRGVGQARFAQAAAGMPGGIGEYITAERQNGEFQEQRVPTSSQWIPNGPLWAGTLGVTGDVQTSDIPAGILAGPGGNGVLSGG